jgi:prepilin signal peptidase PulO-like enzyme (type II secretory pathway)
MLILFTLITTYFYTVLSKFFFWRIVSQDPKGKSYIKNEFSYKNFLPLFSFVEKDYISKRFYKKINRLGELLAIASSIFINYLYIDNVLKAGSRDPAFIDVITMIIINLCVLTFLYLSIYDLIYYEIPSVVIVRLLLVLVIVSISVAISNLLFPEGAFKNLFFGRLSNLIGLFIGYVSTLTLVKLSKESAMGEGDADFNAVVGLLLGFPGIIIYIFVTLILGSIIGLIFAAYKKQFHGLLLPFFPVMLLGFVITLVYQEDLRELLFPYLKVINV